MFGTANVNPAKNNAAMAVIAANAPKPPRSRAKIGTFNPPASNIAARMIAGVRSAIACSGSRRISPGRRTASSSPAASSPQTNENIRRHQRSRNTPGGSAMTPASQLPTSTASAGNTGRM